MKCFTIDQAGKIEQTNEDTILSLCSEEIQYTIKVPKKIKQEIFKACKKRFKKNLVIRVFSYCIYLLIREKIKDEDTILLIDNEYPKHEKEIRNYLLNLIDLKKSHIKFSLLGKNDISHRIANQTFSGRLKPNEIITNNQLNLNRIIPEHRLKEFLK